MASELAQQIVHKLATRNELKTESDQQPQNATLLEHQDPNLTGQGTWEALVSSWGGRLLCGGRHLVGPAWAGGLRCPQLLPVRNP